MFWCLYCWLWTCIYTLSSATQKDVAIYKRYQKKNYIGRSSCKLNIFFSTIHKKILNSRIAVQRLKFAYAVGKCRGIYMFFSVCLGKKNAEAIKFLGILKKYVSKNKIYFCLKKRKMFCLIKKLFLSFTWFSNLIS